MRFKNRGSNVTKMKCLTFSGYEYAINYYHHSQPLNLSTSQPLERYDNCPYFFLNDYPIFSETEE